MTIEQAAKWLKERDNFIILTHMRPDGDTLCSAGALAHSLNKLGKTAYVFPNPEMGEKYWKYIDRYFPPEEYVYSTVVAVDTARSGMITKGADELGRRVQLSIDHHGSNTCYAEKNVIDDSAAACGEIIYDLICAMGVELDEELASLVYIAITTDTGCFEFTNTSSRTLETASKLVAAGAPNGRLNKEFFRTKSRELVALEGRIMSEMEFFADGQIAISTITKELLDECGVSDDMLEGIASLPTMVEGVRVGFTIKELDSERTKVSCRTTEDVDANAICAKFDGGGHHCAAGCRVLDSINKTKELLVEAAGELL